MECLPETIVIIPYIENQSPHCVGTWTPRGSGSMRDAEL